MVHYKPANTAYRRGGGNSCSATNNYWKLGLYCYTDKTAKQLAEELGDKGYKCRENISKAAVILAIGRHQRGLMSYEGRSVDELQTFCRARGLPAKATVASRLARALEKADDLVTFPKFFDLPAEIRNIIYELFFLDLDSFEGAHVQPPLTLASRQLRAEALPLFYECATFEMWAGTRRIYGVHLYCSTKPLWYMPAANFRRIKTLTLFWSRHTYGHSKTDSENVVKIDVHLVDSDQSNEDAAYTSEDEIRENLWSQYGSVSNALEVEESNGALEMYIDGHLFNYEDGSLMLYIE